MEIGLTAKVSPEIDEKESDKQASKLQEKMQESVENLQTGDSLEETLEQVEDMEERLEEAKESMEAMEEAVPDGGRVGSAADAGTGGGADAEAEEPSSLKGLAIERGRERIEGKIGGEKVAKAADNSKSLGKVSSQLGGLKKTLLRGAGAIAVIGFAAFALGKIWDGIKSMAQHSPLLAQVVDMFGLAMSLFFRPFASMIGRFLLPIMSALLRLAANFNKVFGERGLLGALAWLAKQLIVGFINGLWAVIEWAVFELPMILLRNLPKILALVVMGALAVALAPLAGLLAGIVSGILFVAAMFGKTEEVFDFMAEMIMGLYNLLKWSFDVVIGLIVDGLMWVLNNIGDILWLLALPLILLAAVAIPFFQWLWDKFKKVVEWFKDPHIPMDAMGDIAGGIADFAVWLGGFIGGKIADFAVWLGKFVVDKITDFGGWLIGLVIGTIEFGAWLLQFITDKITDFGGWLLGFITDKIVGFGNWLSQFVPDEVKDFGKWLEGFIPGEIRDFGKWLEGFIPSKIDNFDEWLEGFVIGAIRFIIWLTRFVDDKITDFNTWLLKFVDDKITDFGDWLERFIGDPIDDFADWLMRFINLEGGNGNNTQNGDQPGTTGYNPWDNPMASGGIVTGPTSAIIGEGNESEVVLPLSKLGGLLDTGRSNVSRRDLEDALATALGDQLDDINAGVQDLARQIRRKGVSGPIEITADGKVIAEVSEDGRDKYKRSREINR